MKKIFYLMSFVLIILGLTSCHTGKVLVNDNVQFSDDYKTIIYNDVYYKHVFLDLDRTITDKDVLIYKKEPDPFMAAYQMIYKSTCSDAPFIYECIGDPSDLSVRGFYLESTVDLNNLIFIDSFYHSDILIFNEIINCENDEFYSINKAYRNALMNLNDQSYSYYKELLDESKLDFDYEELFKLEFYLKDDPELKFNFKEIYFYNNNYYITEGMECYKLSNKLVSIIIDYFNQI
ncbi:MAG: hypothetical protein IJ966_02470 [Bacilli bacterium]|nr:hypothetical protein [Bacilli bacterium]